MPCIDCFNDCEDSLMSDRCVKYTGSDFTPLGVCDGDSVESVITAVLTQLTAMQQGNNISITGITGCNSILSLTSGTPPTLVSLIQALYTSYCSAASAIASLQASNNNVYSFNVSCLTGLTSTSTTNDIIQAMISQLCVINTSLTAISADYVKASQLNTLIASYIASVNNVTQVVNQYTLAIPYVAYEYYGPLTNFDSSGAGIASKGFSKMYLCNGANGTPDKRGRTTVGAVAGVPGGSLDAAVDPSLPANAGKNYNLKDKFGENSIILDVTQIPSHTHAITDPGHSHTLLPDAGKQQVHRSGDSGGAYRTEDYSISATTTTNKTGITISSAGSSQPHDNVQPSIAANFIIYLP